MSNVLKMGLAVGLGISTVYAADTVKKAAEKPKMAAPVKMGSEKPKAAAPTKEQQAAMAQAMKMGSPSEAHKVLAPLAGKFSNHVRFWMAPDSPVSESNGESNNAWILGGRFIQESYHGTMGNGQPFEGMGITGYDNVKGEYQSLWLDSMMTGMMTASGSFDQASQMIKTSGDFSCPMTGEKARWFRSEVKVLDPDHYTYMSYNKGADGKEFKSIEIMYTRMK